MVPVAEMSGSGSWPINGLFIMTAFGRGANEQDFPLQFETVEAVLVTATLFGRGWMTELPSTLFCYLFIHYMESLLTKAWNSLIIMTVLFVSSLGSTIQFSRTNSLSQHTGMYASWSWTRKSDMPFCQLSRLRTTGHWISPFVAR